MDLQIEEFKKRYNIIIKKDKDNDHGNTTEEKADNEVKKNKKMETAQDGRKFSICIRTTVINK